MTSRARLLRLIACTLSAAAAGCGQSEGEPRRPAESGALPAGVVARAGREQVASATVARIAERQGVDESRALSHALSDAVLAQGARDALPPATIASIERAASARSLMESFAAEAARRGPPTQGELDELVRELWVELDRPAAVRTVHAVVLNDDPAREGAARGVAEKLAEAVHGASSGEDFLKRATAVPRDGFELRAEALPFVTADGRAFEARDKGFVARPSGFDRTFAEAANALDTIGQQSPIVKTAFGFHVIRLEARQPAAGIPPAERATALASEVLSRRAGRLRTELLERLRSGASITRDRAVDELTSRLQKAP